MAALRRLLFILCFVLALFNLTDGLTCYECKGCNDPFNAYEATPVTYPDGMGYSCRKTKALSSVNRDTTTNCVSLHTRNNGVWCCQNSYCNTAAKPVPTSGIVFGLVLAIAGYFL